MNGLVEPWVLLVVALCVGLAFVGGRAVPRRPRVAHIPVTEAKLDTIRDRLDALEHKQDQNDHDVRNIRAAMSAMPTERGMGELREQVALLNGRFEGFHDMMGSNTRSISRIEDYLLNSNKTPE